MNKLLRSQHTNTRTHLVRLKSDWRGAHFACLYLKSLSKAALSNLHNLELQKIKTFKNQNYTGTDRISRNQKRGKPQRAWVEREKKPVNMFCCLVGTLYWGEREFGMVVRVQLGLHKWVKAVVGRVKKVGPNEECGERDRGIPPPRCSRGWNGIQEHRFFFRNWNSNGFLLGQPSEQNHSFCHERIYSWVFKGL